VYSGSMTYVFEGLSAFRSKGCIVGVVVDGVDGVFKLQHFQNGQDGRTNHLQGGGSKEVPLLSTIIRRTQVVTRRIITVWRS
jgi:hypothetical protein